MTQINSSTPEVRVVGLMSDAVKKRVVRQCVIASVLFLGVLFGIIHPDGGYITLSVILVLPTLLMVWAVYREFSALRKPTLIVTPTDLTITRRLRLDLGRVVRRPWANIAAVSMGTHETTRKVNGYETGRDYRPLLQVYIVGADKPVQQFYLSSACPNWQELFQYIHAVAPHVRLTDHQQADLDAHAARRRT
ncbi:hypothetical protein GFY24_14145 [Nocardia sp. SYP-A9097]|uniref:hypothetical protein n=1 Tax=Nocardia sp. SYP-A9097 TaxID=2663237 RepID=UPI00129A47C1|nr:hypothetical protein [Nocardia sp. SYP-A9097]MRH88573.1 hypothetical protein [Nocardia sp. SYP-A9097]